MKKIPLTRGKVAVVDDEDFEWLSKLSWSYSNGYAIHWKRAGGISTNLYMHLMILQPRPGYCGDHIDRDRLNNRRSNLREATETENNRNRGINRNNTSGYRGVSFNKQSGRWEAYIYADGRQRRLGWFDNPDVELYGDFAYLNEIPRGAA